MTLHSTDFFNARIAVCAGSPEPRIVARWSPCERTGRLCCVWERVDEKPWPSVTAAGDVHTLLNALLSRHRALRAA
ncbi:MAG: hypothetical protein P3W95_012055 [Tepidimonas taiwanensis]|nr:hypothetical protein [Tepidimonas taiwanensis]